MNNQRFERTASLTRVKAIIVTLVFHVALFGGIALSGDGDVSTTVKGWIGMDDTDKIEQTDTPGAQKVKLEERADKRRERP